MAPKDTSATKSTTDASSSSSKPSDSLTTSKLSDKSKENDQMLLEDDDEFEEFGVQDWEDKDTDIDSATKPAGNLWEDNWDDDDIEDEFTVQLRAELEKTGQGTTLTSDVVMAH